MKRIFIGSFVFLVIAAAVAGYSSEGDTAAKFVAPGTLSDEQIANLKDSFTDAKTQKEYKWMGEFTSENLDSVSKAKAKLKKKIPYRLTGSLYEAKSVAGRTVFSRVPKGPCWILIKDTAGSVVSQASKGLESMCPS